MRSYRSNIIVIFSFLMTTMFYSQAYSGKKRLTVDVVPDFSTFSFVDLDGSLGPTAGEPFYVEGDVRERRDDFGTGPRIGTFICRGFFIIPQDDGDITYVSQSFEIDGKGTIYVQGNEPGATAGMDGFRRAIVGATGWFPSSGQAIVEPLPTGDRVTFRFDGARDARDHGGNDSDERDERNDDGDDTDDLIAMSEQDGAVSLQQNYPNPFNPETEISFELSNPSQVVVRIFNVLGQEVRTLSQEQYEAGSHTLRWDGQDNLGNPVASGVYLLRLEMEGFSVVKNMSLIR